MHPQLADANTPDLPQALYDLQRALASLRKLPKVQRQFFLALSTLDAAGWTQQNLLRLYQDALLAASPVAHHPRLRTLPVPVLLQRITKSLIAYEHLFSIAYHKQLQALTDGRKMAVLSDLLGSTDEKVKLAALKLWMEFDGNIGSKSSKQSAPEHAAGTRVKVRELHIHPPDVPVSAQYAPVHDADSARSARSVPVKSLTISRLAPPPERG